MFSSFLDLLLLLKGTEFPAIAKNCNGFEFQSSLNTSVGFFSLLRFNAAWVVNVIQFSSI
jgi:hypothetical protein